MVSIRSIFRAGAMARVSMQVALVDAVVFGSNLRVRKDASKCG